MDRDNSLRKSNWSLVGLYVMLLIAVCLLRQIKYYPMLGIILAILAILIILFWKYLLSKQLIKITITSTVFERNLQKNERLFLYGFALFFMPVLKLRNISLGDVIGSILMVGIALGLYLWDESYYKEKR